MDQTNINVAIKIKVNIINPYPLIDQGTRQFHT